jgi:hypothetical protein
MKRILLLALDEEWLQKHLKTPSVEINKRFEMFQIIEGKRKYEWNRLL